MMPSISIVFSFIFLFLFVSSPLAEEPGFTREIKKHFEWGEYDKLVEKLGPFLQNHPDSLNKELLSDFHKYFAVAIFSKGKVSEAREHFHHAYENNPQVTLDKDYVSKPALDLFQSVSQEIEEFKKQAKEVERKDSLIISKELELKKSISTLTEMQINELKVKRRLGITGAVSSFILTGLFTGFSLYEYNIAEENYPKYKSATLSGHLSDSRKYEQIVFEADILTVCSAVAAVLSTASGAYFTIKARKRKGLISGGAQRNGDTKSE